MMKYYCLALCILLSNKLLAQDALYLTDGTKMLGRIIEISPEKVKFKNLANPTGPTYSRTPDNIYFAFNAAGDYLVFTKENPYSEKDKEVFLTQTPKTRFFDTIVDTKGLVTSAIITSETDAEVVCNEKGAEVKLPKASLAFIIRRNGTHQLFASPEQAAPVLATSQGKMNNSLPATIPSPPPVTAVETRMSAQPQAVETQMSAQPLKTTGKVVASSDVSAPMDMKLFNRKALEKTEEFTGYMQMIAAVNTNREAAKKGINLASALFLSPDSRVEVSSVNTTARNKYKIRDYLDRLMLRSGQFDKVQIEYANVNYASKFKKGADGNYYGIVTFVQTFRGFVDNKVVYGDVTKRNVTVVLKPYEKSVNGESMAAWDVFLDDVGVVETKKS